MSKASTLYLWGFIVCSVAALTLLGNGSVYGLPFVIGVVGFGILTVHRQHRDRIERQRPALRTRRREG